MQLEHSFSVPVGIDEAWRILLDIERIGPCMPGAAIDSVDGDDFTGTVKVKLGPINLTYKGKASFIEKDEAAHRAVIDARGKDARGNGTAAAKVTARLTETGAATTTVSVQTDLDITGKPAQFGRGVMVDVGNKLIGQFADSAGRHDHGRRRWRRRGSRDSGGGRAGRDGRASRSGYAGGRAGSRPVGGRAGEGAGQEGPLRSRYRRGGGSRPQSRPAAEIAAGHAGRGRAGRAAGRRARGRGPARPPSTGVTELGERTFRRVGEATSS